MPPRPATKPTTKSGPQKSSPAKSSRTSRQKAAPKQPLPVADRLKRLFTSLCAQIDGGHFANAIKTCDKILRLDKHDPDALQTKLFLLLQTDQYAAALAMADAPSGLPGDTESTVKDHTFEKAYSLYRLHREADASEAMKELKDRSDEVDRGVLHLEAQLAYRQGNYQTAFELYNQLLDTADPNSEEHSDILTNLEAAQKHVDFLTSGFLHALDALPPAVSSTLESAPPPVAQPHQQQQAVLASAQAPSETQKPRKVRMKRVPKGVVPGVTPPPDPERWLKKSERTTSGQGGRRRKGGAGGGATQGAMESTGGAGGKKSGGGKGKKK
ncbi:hypothetical protein BD309DRAFT_1022519 [Dichomitus squalens]|uniref:Signal recognition particle subunit SRP72 n=2 Tax=Dichomitus squalens TaxID=114155 RepID=A0A4Q9PHB2_9APHY|nr:uncharacterized protein DICSQDRAFT_71995 [Dichomitus squalens LYAD-421 SS1]EJF56192.1 hypothetical protein DICSQDRAFT_71995 [Dichomitus squalens LYAD-421 SS1]TBU38918.1 hypothetical protein BD309DRAFT_1022519 [Dichomitus squalens]TBU52196.1 hypothetical protein BD310DRAFT_249884 [Dichomitus squalens]